MCSKDQNAARKQHFSFSILSFLFAPTKFDLSIVYFIEEEKHILIKQTRNSTCITCFSQELNHSMDNILTVYITVEKIQKAQRQIHIFKYFYQYQYFLLVCISALYKTINTFKGLTKKYSRKSLWVYSFKDSSALTSALAGRLLQNCANSTGIRAIVGERH